MKKCTMCQEDKELTEFFIRSSRLGRLHSCCKDCKREIDRKAYSENKHDRKQRIRDVAKALHEWSKEFINRVRRRSKCEKCGEDRFYVLDFHHVTGKIKSISQMNAHSINSIKKEMRKCKVLCSNCHREEHYLLGEEANRVEAQV